MNHLLLLLLKSIEVQCTDSDVARSQRACFGPWRKSLLGTSFLDEAEEGFFPLKRSRHTLTHHMNHGHSYDSTTHRHHHHHHHLLIVPGKTL